MSDNSRHSLGWALALLFALAMIMGAGPGMELINKPEPLFGLPALYVWGLAWYGVQVFVVVAAFLFVWRDEEDEVAPADEHFWPDKADAPTDKS